MRNKIVAGLIVATGVLFTTALFLPSATDNPETLLNSILLSGRLYGLGVITGLSAVATRFLIKETK